MKDYFNKERVYVLRTTDGQDVGVSYKPPLLDYLHGVADIGRYITDLSSMLFSHGSTESKSHKARQKPGWVNRNQKNNHKHQKLNNRHNPGRGQRGKW